MIGLVQLNAPNLRLAVNPRAIEWAKLDGETMTLKFRGNPDVITAKGPDVPECYGVMMDAIARGMA